MKKRWLRLKDTEEYREMNKKRSKEWYYQNREKHNLRMKYYMREYYRKKYSKEARNGTKIE